MATQQQTQQQLTTPSELEADSLPQEQEQEQEQEQVTDDLPEFDGTELDDVTTSADANDLMSLDWGSEKGKKVAETFQALGVDVVAAVEAHRKLLEYVETVQQQQVEMRATAAATQLQNSWGVNEAEFRRRIELVNTYAAKYPAKFAPYDNVEGIQYVWDKVFSKKQSGGGNARGSATVTQGKTYKASELRQMMRTDPKGYAKIADEVQKAYADGRVSSD